MPEILDEMFEIRPCGPQQGGVRFGDAAPVHIFLRGTEERAFHMENFIRGLYPATNLSVLN